MVAEEEALLEEAVSRNADEHLVQVRSHEDGDSGVVPRSGSMVDVGNVARGSSTKHRQGGKVEASEEEDFTRAHAVLFSKCRHGRTQEVKAALAAGAVLDATDEAGNTLMAVRRR